jgi:L-alanine-DL-glutamate epimerase-like enolase superfamily enzyme
LTAGEVAVPVRDGLPESLEQWIPYSGVRAIKIKLNGNDLKWDVERVAAIDKVARSGQIFSLDFNEKCPNVEYLLEFIGRQEARVFARVQYIEQPTKRDLEQDRGNLMFAAAKLKPVVIDESLTGIDRLRLAREMGYSGAALKACKGQSQSLLIAAAVQKYKMFRCVQDLTCPGAAFVHSAQLASHIPGTAAVEANAREYVPSASVGWEKRYPGLFDVRDGWLRTKGLGGAGLGTS